MVYLKDILDYDLLVQHIADGLVTERTHESLPFAIYNYTPKAQFDRVWDDVTKKCRGLIVNTETGEIVARPFEKFYNWDEGGAPFPPTGPAIRMPKMDGSLGILYKTSKEKSGLAVDAWAISTRGSMHSEQAEWATEFFRNERVAQEFGFDDEWSPGQTFLPLDDKTYLFEIIYPENRIVVDYGEHEGLTLIDVIDNTTGFSDTDEFDNCNWPDKVVRKPVPGFDSGQAQEIPEGDEGFVYLWPVRNFRTKMKAAQYVILHRLISNLNEKTIWEQLVAGKTLVDIKRDIPEEFHSFVDEKGWKIIRDAALIVGLTTAIFEDELSGIKDRAEFARAVKEKYPKYAKYLFLMLDGRDVHSVALRDSKPRKKEDA